jgi:hypothetical protein
MNNLNLHDRINVIGASTVKEICTRVRDMGIPAVALGQHEDGGYFEPKFIDPFKEVLAHCRNLGLKVIMRTHDISKCNYGNPAGWPLEKFHAHRPRRTRFEKWIDARHNLNVLLHDSQVYNLEFTSDSPCEVFLFFGGVQIARLGSGANLSLEFVSHCGPGYYDIVFRGAESVSIAKLETVQSQHVVDFRYIGKKGVSGHYLARTGNLSDEERKLDTFRKTVRRIDLEYSEFRDIICGTIADIDEFSACGGVYNSGHLKSYIRDLAMLSHVLWEVPMYGWMRPYDWFANAGHANYPEPNRPIDFDEAVMAPAFWPIAWAEKTTVEECQYLYSRTMRGMAGVYLTHSNPAHFRAAGFDTFSAFWWPKSGESYLRNFPYAELEQTVREFENV